MVRSGAGPPVYRAATNQHARFGGHSDFPLDYGRTPRMCVGQARGTGGHGLARDGMNINVRLEALSRRLLDAAAITQAAVTCARSGSEREAVDLMSR